MLGGFGLIRIDQAFPCILPSVRHLGCRFLDLVRHCTSARFAQTKGGDVSIGFAILLKLEFCDWLPAVRLDST